MELTYKQVGECLVEVFKNEFDRKTGRQELAKFDCINDVPMRMMTHLLFGVGDKAAVAVKQ